MPILLNQETHNHIRSEQMHADMRSFVYPTDGITGNRVQAYMECGDRLVTFFKKLKMADAKKVLTADRAALEREITYMRRVCDRIEGCKVASKGDPVLDNFHNTTIISLQNSAREIREYCHNIEHELQKKQSWQWVKIIGGVMVGGVVGVGGAVLVIAATGGLATPVVAAVAVKGLLAGGTIVAAPAVAATTTAVTTVAGGTALGMGIGGGLTAVSVKAKSRRKKLTPAEKAAIDARYGMAKTRLEKRLSRDVEVALPVAVVFAPLPGGAATEKIHDKKLKDLPLLNG